MHIRIIDTVFTAIGPYKSVASAYTIWPKAGRTLTVHHDPHVSAALLTSLRQRGTWPQNSLHSAMHIFTSVCFIEGCRSFKVHSKVFKGRPPLLSLSLGADSLANDRLGCFNLSLKGHGEAVRFMKEFRLPMLVTGGEGCLTHLEQ